MKPDEDTDLLRRMARRYNRPPEVPREAIWAAIQERRTRAAGHPRWRAHPPWWRLVWWPAGAAAVLVLGILIGRIWFPREASPPAAWTAATAPADRRAAEVYQQAALPYLNRAETLLTQFRMESATGSPNERLSAWARGLLTETRLIMDSPAAADPEFYLLLDDLEMALAQIAHLAAGQDTREAQWINQGLDRGAVLKRLRARIPAGSAVTGI